MKSFLIKIFPVVIIGLTVYSLGEIIYILINYENTGTSFPLRTVLFGEIALWGIPIFVLTIVYILILKYNRK